MYIHNYQIHNVLNAYRKQLSQSPDTIGSKRSDKPTPKDMVSLSQQGQQPSLVNKISAEIIDRITQFGPQSEFEDALANQLSTPKENRPMQASPNGIEFSYTLIDEQNRKTTHSLPIQAMGNQNNQMPAQNPPSPDMAKAQQPVKALFDNQQETSKIWKG